MKSEEMYIAVLFYISITYLCTKEEKVMAS